MDRSAAPFRRCAPEPVQISVPFTGASTAFEATIDVKLWNKGPSGFMIENVNELNCGLT
jgi:hypothetical protein